MEPEKNGTDVAAIIQSIGTLIESKHCVRIAMLSVYGTASNVYGTAASRLRRVQTGPATQ
jgi:hypothetical protein